MNKFFKMLAVVVASVFAVSGIGYADTIGESIPIEIVVVIGAVADIDVVVRNISDDVESLTIGFTDPLSQPWTVANQYLNVTYNCNLPLYSIRIVSDNKDAAYYPGMYGKPIAANGDGDGDGDPWDGPPEANPLSDDTVSYAGLIDSATADNPDNRAGLGWQVYADKLGAGVFPDAVLDSSFDPIEGEVINWNAPWAAMVDKSDTDYVDSTDADDDINTFDYQHLVIGGASSSGLNYHPAEYVTGVLQPKPGDGDIAVYLAARIQGLSAGSYGTNMMVELVYPL